MWRSGIFAIVWRPRATAYTNTLISVEQNGVGGSGIIARNACPVIERMRSVVHSENRRTKRRLPKCRVEWTRVQPWQVSAFTVAPIAEVDVHRAALLSTSVKNGLESLVRVYMAADDYIDSVCVEQSFHVETHQFSFSPMARIRIVPRGMPHTNDPWSDVAIKCGQVTLKPPALK